MRYANIPLTTWKVALFDHLWQRDSWKFLARPRNWLSAKRYAPAYCDTWIVVIAGVVLCLDPRSDGTR